MYIFRNAIKNILRNKGRNILIGIIIAVISAACAVTLAIRSAADKIVTAYEKKYPVTASIEMNREYLSSKLKEKESQEEMINAFNDIKPLTLNEVKNYGDSDYLSSYSYNYSVSMNAKDITEATDSLVKETTKTETETETRTEKFENPPSRGKRSGESGTKSTTTRKKTTTIIEKIKNEKLDKGAFTILGYDSYSAMSEFVNGEYTIIDGKVSDDFQSNTCIISEELATLNDIKINDKITLISPNNEDITYELEVTGIYKDNSSKSGDMKNMFSSSANNIITNVKVIESLIKKDEKLVATVTPTYILKNSEYIDLFKEEITKKGLSEYYTISDNYDVISSATKSIINVKNFALMFLIITLFIGAIVLLVINMINIRERKYEIGVLRTIGMSKFLVSIQFMFELLIISIIALFIGAGVGAVSSVNISNELLRTEIEASENELDDINNNFGGMKQRGKKEEFKVTKIKQVDSIDATVDLQVLIQLLGIGIGLTIVGSLVSMVSISRFSPLQILKERS